MTVVQKQLLLAFLGYLPAEGADGIWGSRSQQAARNFQEDIGLTPDGIPGPDTEKALRRAVTCGMPEKEEQETTGTFWDEIKFFTRDEFRCRCGGRYCSGFPAEMKEAVVRIANAAREHFGRRGYVVSGLRCDRWNTIQGGVANSQHKFGEALDLRIENTSAEELLSFLQTQPIRYAYAINGTNVHFDIEKGDR